MLPLLLALLFVSACSDRADGPAGKAAAGAAPTSQAETPVPQEEGVIARVGDQVITFGQLNTMLNSSAMVGLSIPALGTPERNQVIITLLDKAISANLLYLDAKQQGVDRSVRYTTDLAKLENAVLASMYEQKVLIGELPVSEEEVQAFYASSISPGTELTDDVKLAIEAKLRNRKLEARRATLRERLREGVRIDIDKTLDVGVEWRGAAQVGGGQNGAVIGGANYGIQGGMNDLLAGIAAGTPLIFPGSGLVAGGIGGSVTLPDGTKVPAIAAVLRASQGNNNLNILSSPHLLTQNNKEAEIIVAENIPFISSQSRDSTNLANVINTVERKDVGITLRLTPHIHESEFVSLDIYQEASALKTDAVTLAQTTTVGPTWTKRSAKTTVLVKSGDTVILGGIMQESNTENVSKVPVLGDIPLLGWLFKTKSKQKQKTNLVILLTPFIIQEPGRLASGLEERQRIMLQPFNQNADEVRRALPSPQQPEPQGGALQPAPQGGLPQ